MADFSQLEERMLHLEREFAEMKVTASEQRARLRESIAENTTAIAQIRETADATKADTAEIVAALKGFKVLGMVTKWIGGPTAAGGVVYAVGKAAKWWV